MSMVVAAPTAARLFAIYGADVIKVEAPTGDVCREMGEAYCCTIDDYANPCFDLHNSGKKLTSIDLKSEKGHELFMQLLNDADVFITNIRPQALKRLKIDYESVKESNPRLIYGHFSGYGQKGPDCDRAGFDNSAFWMRTGPELEWQEPGSRPFSPSFAFGDIATATDLYAGILAALIGREKTGKGTLVTTSLYGNGIWLNSESIVQAQPQYGRKFKADRYHPHDPFAKTYLTKDGKYIAIYDSSYARDKARFAKFFGIEDLLSDPRAESYKTLRESDYIVEVVKKIEEIIATKTAEEWCELLEASDIAHEKLRDFIDVYTDEQAYANGYLEKVEMGDGKITSMPLPPTSFSEYSKVSTVPLGGIGADTDEIFSSLGYSKEEIAAFKDQKIIR